MANHAVMRGDGENLLRRQRCGIPGGGIARSNMGEVRVDLSRATLCLGECLTLRSAQPILIKGIDPDRHVQAEFPCQVAHPCPRAGHLHIRPWPCPGRQPFLLTKGTERVVGFAAADERNMALPRDDKAGKKVKTARGGVSPARPRCPREPRAPP